MNLVLLSLVEENYLVVILEECVEALVSFFVCRAERRVFQCHRYSVARWYEIVSFET